MTHDTAGGLGGVPDRHMEGRVSVEPAERLLCRLLT
jgi:hypothetical protein